MASSSSADWTEDDLCKLNAWIYCLCLVDFDLTEGQTVRFCYPFDILCDDEKSNIANLAFPDTHNTGQHQCANVSKFVFRFRARVTSASQSQTPSNSKSQSSQDDDNTIAISYSHRHRHKYCHPYLFGYVYFLQKPDASMDRGYFQKALVVITPIPYTHVFMQAIDIVGSLYFEYKSGNKILDTACRNICAWPLPSIEGEVSLPLLGRLIRSALSPKSVPPSASIVPGKFQKRKPPIAGGNEEKIDAAEAEHKSPPKVAMENEYNNNLNGYELVEKYATQSQGGCFQEVNIHRYFHAVLGNLWCLWELALTGQPLLVMASSAEQCCHAVLGIMSLISPIAYHGDFRPYFTIYDDDFKHFCDLHDRQMLPPLILGVTNPFFLKTMNQFPNILVLSNDDDDGDANKEKNGKDDEQNAAPAKADDDENGKDIKSKAADDVMTIHVKASSSSEHQHQATVNRRAWTSAKEVDLSEARNCIITKSTPCLIPNEQLLCRLLTVSKATTASGATLQKNALAVEQICILNNATLRKYFQSLTEKFLEPFQQYFAFTVPAGIWNPYLSPPTLRTFQTESFLNTIREIPKSFIEEIPLRTSTLPSGKRSVLVKLYAKFLKSPHFPLWFNKKRERAKKKCDKIVQKMIRKIRFERLVEGKPVREGIQIYQAIHRHLNNNNQSAKPKADVNDVLIRHRAVLRSALPSQIIQALDEQVEKMREEQVRKKKEWQIKYQEHIKQQKRLYNLDVDVDDKLQ